MPRTFLVLVFALGLGVEPPAYSAPASRPEYHVHRAQGAISIDGDLSDAAWQAADVVSLQFYWPAQTGPKQLTRVRLLWDDQNIYFAFDCDDTDITAKHTRRDDPTYEDDAAEIFLNPFPDRNEYVGLEINAIGVLYDYLFVHPQKLYSNYDLKGVQLAVRRRNGTSPGWSLEGQIPIENLLSPWDHAPVKEGTVWTMNLSRWDGTEPHRAFSMWSNSGLPNPNPHAPDHFGRMIFAH